MSVKCIITLIYFNNNNNRLTTTASPIIGPKHIEGNLVPCIATTSYYFKSFVYGNSLQEIMATANYSRADVSSQTICILYSYAHVCVCAQWNTIIFIYYIQIMLQGSVCSARVHVCVWVNVTLYPDGKRVAIQFDIMFENTSNPEDFHNHIPGLISIWINKVPFLPVICGFMQAMLRQH